jgi:hypothetical protein
MGIRRQSAVGEGFDVLIEEIEAMRQIMASIELVSP